jgi:hypothetical protein
VLFDALEPVTASEPAFEPSLGPNGFVSDTPRDDGETVAEAGSMADDGAAADWGDTGAGCRVADSDAAAFERAFERAAE